MTVVGIIPARYASTRFPGKTLAPINKFPMVHHVYSRALQCEELDDVIIATDHPLVARTCALLEDKVYLTQANHKSGTDRIAEVARTIDADIIVNIQGDEPQLDPKIVDDLVKLMKTRPKLNMGTIASTALEEGDLTDANIVKVLVDVGQALEFYRDLPDELPDGVLMRHVGIYAYRKQYLLQFTETPQSGSEKKWRLEQLRALDMGTPIGVVVSDYRGISVDTPADLRKVVASWEEIKAK